MLLKKLRSCVVLGVALLAGSETTWAQAPHQPGSRTPFAPAEGVWDNHNFRPFEAADLSEYGNGPQPNEGFFFDYDRVVWAFNSPKTVEIGDPDSEGVILVGTAPIFNTNDISTDFMETEWVWGNRYELGYVNDQQGWLVSLAHVHEYHQNFVPAGFVNIAFFDPFNSLLGFVDNDGDGVVDDINQNGIFGNNNPFNFDQGTPNPNPPPPFVPPQDGILDTRLPTDFGDQIVSPIFFANSIVRNKSSLSTIELMHINRLDRFHYGGNFEWLFGVRFINFTDAFNFRGINLAANRVFNQAEIDMRINNYLVGPQLGMRWNRQTGPWKVGVEARFLAAANFQQARLQGAFQKFPNNNVFAGNPQEFNSAVTTEEFSPVGEFRFDTSYQVTKAISLQIGYTALAMGSISRAARRIDYILPAPQIKEDDNQEFAFINGFNFGVEINR